MRDKHRERIAEQNRAEHIRTGRAVGVIVSERNAAMLSAMPIVANN